MTGEIFIGTAGWALPAHYQPQFPAGGSHLERYAGRFNAVEINSSFHKPHRRSSYERWASSVPEGFRFSVKLNRAISHDRRLVDCDALLAAFLDQVGGLGEKLGAILVQLPPSLAFDPGVAGAFFTVLRADTTAAILCEPRHASWFSDSAEDMLRRHRIARVAADPSRIEGAERPGGSTASCYLRLHGSPAIYRSSYDGDRLRDYAAMIAQAAGQGPAWCIFDNTASMAATGDALRFRKIVAGLHGKSGTSASPGR